MALVQNTKSLLLRCLEGAAAQEAYQAYLKEVQA